MKQIFTQQSITTRVPRRSGATLIDVAMGSMLLAVVLIPSVRLIRDSESTHRERANREVMLFEAERLLEESKIWLRSSSGGTTNFQRVIGGGRQNWVSAIVVADAPPLQSTTLIEQDSSLGRVGTVEVQLVTITTNVWQDQNGNRRPDAGEPIETLVTQWTET